MRTSTERENPIAVRSRAALLAATIALLDERDASTISVKDIVEAAGMSRPTFYQHHADLGSAFAAAGLTRLAELLADVRVAPDGDLALLVTRMEQHARFFKRVQESQGGSAFQAGAIAATSARLRGASASPDDRDDAWWAFVAAGVVWTVTRHLAAYCQTPDDPALDAVGDLTRILDRAGATPAHAPSAARQGASR